MNYIEVINDAIDYIEDNLSANITHTQVAEELFVSPYHFFRVFRAVTNYTVKEYVEKRRMSNVLDQLENTDKKLIDIALENGFNSPEVFTRSFKRNYGISPRQFRNAPIYFARFDKIEVVKRNFVNKKNSIFVNYKIIEEGDRKVYGKRIVFNDMYEDRVETHKEKLTFPHQYFQENSHLIYYIMKLELKDNLSDVECFLGLEGLEDTTGLEEYTIKGSKYLSIEYNLSFYSIDDVTNATIRNDVYQLLTQLDYKINDTSVKMMEVYDSSYLEKGNFEMRIPIL